jgi:hypothetical protein
MACQCHCSRSRTLVYGVSHLPAPNRTCPGLGPPAGVPLELMSSRVLSVEELMSYAHCVQSRPLFRDELELLTDPETFELIGRASRFERAEQRQRDVVGQSGLDCPEVGSWDLDTTPTGLMSRVPISFHVAGRPAARPSVSIARGATSASRSARSSSGSSPTLRASPPRSGSSPPSRPALASSCSFGCARRARRLDDSGT